MTSSTDLRERLLAGSIEEIRRVVRTPHQLVAPPPRKRLRDLLEELPAGDEE